MNNAKYFILLGLLAFSMSTYADDISQIDKKCNEAYKAKHQKSIVNYCKKGADLGSMKSQYIWGKYLWRGGKGDVKAKHLFELSAGQGYVNAFIALGFIHTHGLTVPKDECKGKDYFEKAVNAGSITVLR